MSEDAPYADEAHFANAAPITEEDPFARMKRNIAKSHQNNIDEATHTNSVNVIQKSAPGFTQSRLPVAQSAGSYGKEPSAFASAAEPILQRSPGAVSTDARVLQNEVNDIVRGMYSETDAFTEGAPEANASNAVRYNATLGAPNVTGLDTTVPNNVPNGTQYNATDTAPFTQSAHVTQQSAPAPSATANVVQNTAPGGASLGAPTFALDNANGESLVAQMLSVVSAKEALLGAALSQVLRWSFSGNTVTGFVATPFLKNKLESESPYVSSVLSEVYGAPIRFVTELSAEKHDAPNGGAVASKKAELLCNVFKGTLVS